MPAVDFVVSTPTSQSTRALQVSSMFDVPMGKTSSREWNGDVPIDAKPWNVGLIVGPSGAGKTSVMRQLFGEMQILDWAQTSVVDDFARELSLQKITDACSAVGFNTIPAWLRPYHVLSNGEKFRVDLARRLVELPDPIVVDEFTSVVDRQVAQIGSHAVQKFARREGRKFVAVTCHYDVIDWLQPDWVLEPATMNFVWRSLQPRPTIQGHIQRVKWDVWHTFAPFHYLTADLHKAARCFATIVDGKPTAFAAMLHRPHPQVRDIMGCSRLVTLPDWQGIGMAFVLIDACGAMYKAIGKRLHTYPAHPALIRAFDRSKVWKMTSKPSLRSPLDGKRNKSELAKKGYGTRPCAVFEYVGPAMDRAAALSMLEGL